MWWRVCACILPLLAIACVVGTGAEAMGSDITDDEVYFEYLNNETDTVYTGQYEIGLVTYFSQNATDYEVVASAPFFKTNLTGWTQDTRQGGHSSHQGIALNPSAVPGHYDIPVWFNYTDDNGTRVEQRFDLFLDVVRAWELRSFRITSDMRLVLEVETLIDCERLRVAFDTDGGLEVWPRDFELADVGPGTHRFEGDLSGGGGLFRSDEEEVGYDVRGLFNGTTLQLSEKNIDPSSVMEDGGGGWLWLIVLMALVIVVIALVFQRRRRRNGVSSADGD